MAHSSGAEHLAVVGRMAYIADGHGGLVIFYLLQGRQRHSMPLTAAALVK
jgi:hypothetical protein